MSRPFAFKPITRPNGLTQDALVSELINPEERTWNMELIRTVFWADDVDLIQTIILGRVVVPDKRVWHFTQDGRFSVRSAYHVAVEINERARFDDETRHMWRNNAGDDGKYGEEEVVGMPKWRYRRTCDASKLD
ncbi:hypothetical protein BUALT_Bualt04G0034100 [Buddleja alternifolia]|uniref:Uncharacterized protein n=1 Tax=Buddleja alternifolia TaxID=168488 RepID=A0AAV6XKY9_9LAMI|nr:hypothetical protein BUALT_Bualt04G0034100 [Buddleja alternifolia]